MSSLERLTQLVPPPLSLRELGYRPDWERIESQLGTALPSDYKELAGTYGSGDFCSRVALSAPPLQTGTDFSSEDAFAAGFIQTVDVLRDLDSFTKIGIWPDPGGLLTAANITTGSELLWVTSGLPDQWECAEMTVTMDAVVPLGTDLTTTLLRWISGELTTDFLSPPDPPWRSGPYFESFTSRSTARVRIAIDGPGLDRSNVESAVVEAAGGERVLWTDYEEGSHWTSLNYLPILDLAVRLRGGGPVLGMTCHVHPSREAEFKLLVQQASDALHVRSQAVSVRWDPPTC